MLCLLLSVTAGPVSSSPGSSSSSSSTHHCCRSAVGTRTLHHSQHSCWQCCHCAQPAAEQQHWQLLQLRGSALVWDVGPLWLRWCQAPTLRPCVPRPETPVRWQ
jgi:hypothetical protein